MVPGAAGLGGKARLGPARAAMAARRSASARSQRTLTGLSPGPPLSSEGPGRSSVHGAIRSGKRGDSSDRPRSSRRAIRPEPSSPPPPATPPPESRPPRPCASSPIESTNPSACARSWATRAASVSDAAATARGNCPSADIAAATEPDRLPPAAGDDPGIGPPSSAANPPRPVGGSPFPDAGTWKNSANPPSASRSRRTITES